MTLEAVNLDTNGELGLVPVTSTARPMPVDEVGIFRPVDLGIITGEPGFEPLTLPPIASKRWTMSVIEVRRRPCLRGLSSGTDRLVGFDGVSVFPSEVDFDIGKASIDCGLAREDETGVLPDEGVFVLDACFVWGKGRLGDRLGERRWEALSSGGCDCIRGDVGLGLAIEEMAIDLLFCSFTPKSLVGSLNAATAGL